MLDEKEKIGVMTSDLAAALNDLPAPEKFTCIRQFFVEMLSYTEQTDTEQLFCSLLSAVDLYEKRCKALRDHEHTAYGRAVKWLRENGFPEASEKLLTRITAVPQTEL